jgi:hypothetical protein
MSTGPTYGAAKVLKRMNLKLSDVHVCEVTPHNSYTSLLD